jgi:bacillolysin
MKTIFKMFTIFFFSGSFAQNINYHSPVSIFEIAKNEHNNGWVELKEDISLNHQTVFLNHKSAFGLGQDDEMILTRVSSNTEEWTHYHFQQYHKGIKVEGGQFIIHEKDGNALQGNLKIIYNFDISDFPLITPEYAFQIAIDSISNSGKSVSTDSFTYNLVFTPANADILIKDNYRLAYEIDIHTDFDELTAYVNAANGEIIRFKSNIYKNCVDGYVNTLYYQLRTLQTKKSIYMVLWNKYTLKCGGVETVCFNPSSSECYDAQISSNIWNDETNRPVATAHWAGQMTYSYFLQVFQRWSVDHDGKPFVILVGNPDGGIAYTPQEGLSNHPHYNDDYKNHFVIVTGIAIDGVNDWPVAIDVIGHEYTHGVIKYTANLFWERESIVESTALNESFADIFGKMVEWWAVPEHFSWDLGHKIFYSTTPNVLRRSMQNPHLYEDAASYGDLYWNDFSEGYEEIKYKRAGVQNHWFYLLSDGGIYNGITVQGIGKEMAVSIAYYMLNNLLGEYSNYLDSRNASILAASILYGDCSYVVESVINAWKAVNVIDPGGLDYNKDVDCNYLTLVHEGITIPGIITIPPKPVTIRAINTLTANCNITPNGEPVTFVAGNEIRLLPGFSSGDNFSAYIEPCIDISNKNMMSENNNNLHYYEYSDLLETTKLEQYETFSENNIFAIHPNPFSNSFTISIAQPEQTDAKICLTDAYGRQVLGIFSGSIDKGQHSIDVSTDGITKGLYFCVMETPSGRNVVKVVKTE